MNSVELEQSIDAFLSSPNTPPPIALAEFAHERGWIGRRHLNWCINLEGQIIREQRRRRVLDEIGFVILRNYIATQRASSPDAFPMAGPPT